MRRALKLPIAITGSCLAFWASSHMFSAKSQHGNSDPNDKTDFITRTKTYIWGNGIYQPKPDARFRFRNYEPKLIKSFSGPDNINFKELYFGEHHECGIDLNGDVYIWKKHKLDSSVSEGDDVRSELIHLDRGKNNVQVSFSKEHIWVLKDSGYVFQYNIFLKKDPKKKDAYEAEIDPAPTLVEELEGIVQISGGEDHLAALDDEGSVWEMGDDTLGQCGQGAQRRNCAPPFFPKRVTKPSKVPRLSNIEKIVCGANHTLALTADGVVFGWGSNSNLQLSHAMEFAAPENPLLAVFSPIRIEKNLGPIIVTDIAAGEEFSVFVGRNRYTSETEVYGCGHNLHGEIGTGSLSHIQEVIKIESLSNYKVKLSEDAKPTDVKVDQISCGNSHCMALLSIGALLIWGGNEHGQLGNQKRVWSENPIFVKSLENEKVIRVCCGYSNSGVITEYREENDNTSYVIPKKPTPENSKEDNSRNKARRKEQAKHGLPSEPKSWN